MHARERRLVDLPEPVQYDRYLVTISDSDGIAHVPHRCPVALRNPVACACHMVRQGTLTKHGVIGPGFPVALSGVARLRCQTHARTFNMLNPLVHEDLPASVVVRPEVIVLTDDLVLLKEAYEDLVMQVGTAPLHSVISRAASVITQLATLLCGIVKTFVLHLTLSLCAGP